MFQLASYLSLTGAVSSVSFLKQSCWETHPVVMEKSLISFRSVILMACINQRKHLKRLLKLLTLG